MTIIRSTVMGFCFGVHRAVLLLEEALEQGLREHKPVYTIGPLIHNEQFLDSQEKMGVRVISSPEDGPPGIAVIRAHGIPPVEQRGFIEAGFSLIDGTCVRVQRSQKLVSSFTKEGSTVLIAGDKHHGEVISLMGFAQKPGAVFVIKECPDLDILDLGKKVLLIAQTTFSREMYLEIQGCLTDKVKVLGVENTEIFDSICPATKKRQEALKRLTEHVEGIVVVGGRQSANTKRLYEIVNERRIPAWLISSGEEITEEMRKIPTMGITAGASTPEWVIEEVIQKLQGA